MALFGVTALVMTSWTCLKTFNSFFVPDSPHVSGPSVCFLLFSLPGQLQCVIMSCASHGQQSVTL